MSSLASQSATPAPPTLEFELSHPTPRECQHIWHHLSTPWRDALTPSQFLEESAHLLTVPLAKDGGMTSWILVQKDSVPDQRVILASCETFRKRVLVASASKGKEGEGKAEVEAEEGVVHGIASVFCEGRFRGKGYPKVMLGLLGSVLRGWQVGEGKRVVGSVLYSDIGKKYYSGLGWLPSENNTHVQFPAKSYPEIEGVKLLQAEHLAQLCKEDEWILRRGLAKASPSQDRDRMTIIPDHAHMLWHHAKEEFVAEKLFGSSSIPRNKGVIVGTPNQRVWAIWTHRWYSDPRPVPSGNVLYILRLVVQDLGRGDAEVREQLRVVIQSAQAEAERWNLDVVKVWNPDVRVRRLLRGVGVEYDIVEREDDGIASFFWFGDGERPEWLGNEKYAWC